MATSYKALNGEGAKSRCRPLRRGRRSRGASLQGGGAAHAACLQRLSLPPHSPTAFGKEKPSLLDSVSFCFPERQHRFSQPDALSVQIKMILQLIPSVVKHVTVIQ